MKTVSQPLLRTTLRMATFAFTATLAACTTVPSTVESAAARHCYRSPNRMAVPLCTTAALPTADAARDAQTFAADPAAVTVYVIRHSWADAAERVNLLTPHAAEAQLLPKTFARLRLPAGQTTLTAQWSQGSLSAVVTGAAGSVQFLEFNGTVWAWGADFRFEPVDEATGQARVRGLQLVADVAGLAVRPRLSTSRQD